MNCEDCKGDCTPKENISVEDMSVKELLDLIEQLENVVLKKLKEKNNEIY